MTTTTTTFSAEVPGNDPDLVVAVFPGFKDVVVVKHPQSFVVYLAFNEGHAQVFATVGEEDADFAAACAFAAVEAARIYREYA